MTPNISTIDPQEIKKFAMIANEWWNESGKFKPLHMINPIRINYIKEKLCKYFDLDQTLAVPFAGLKLLDVGCGGGLLTEPMSRLGAEVTGIDACEESIKSAIWHSSEVGLSIDYQVNTVETLAKGDEKFDIILAMEVIEHVANPEEFIAYIAQLLKPRGMMVLSTINRTWQSYIQAIIGAEYILRWLPRGTHDWNKFITLIEICSLLRMQNMFLQDSIGIKLSLCRNEWYLSDNTNVNYMVTARPT